MIGHHNAPGFRKRRQCSASLAVFSSHLIHPPTPKATSSSRPHGHADAVSSCAALRAKRTPIQNACVLFQRANAASRSASLISPQRKASRAALTSSVASPMASSSKATSASLIILGPFIRRRRQRWGHGEAFASEIVILDLAMMGSRRLRILNIARERQDMCGCSTHQSGNAEVAALPEGRQPEPARRGHDLRPLRRHDQEGGRVSHSRNAGRRGPSLAAGLDPRHGGSGGGKGHRCGGGYTPSTAA